MVRLDEGRTMRTWRESRRSGFNEEQGPLHVRIEMRIVKLLINFAQRLHTHNPRVQNQDIHPPVLLDRFVIQKLCLCRGGDVRFD